MSETGRKSPNIIGEVYALNVELIDAFAAKIAVCQAAHEDPSQIPAERLVLEARHGDLAIELNASEKDTLITNLLERYGADILLHRIPHKEDDGFYTVYAASGSDTDVVPVYFVENYVYHDGDPLMHDISVHATAPTRG